VAVFSVTILASCLAWGCGRSEGADSGEPGDHLLEFEVRDVSYQEVDRDIEGLGSLVVHDKATVVSRIDGVVVRRMVKKGDQVARGDPLLMLSNRQLELEKLKLDEEVLVAREELETARMQYEEEERDLHRRFYQIEKLDIQIRNLERELAFQREHLERKRVLFDRGGITREELRGLEFSLESGEGELALLQKERELACHGFRDADLLSAGLEVPGEERRRRELLVFINTGLARKRIEFARIRLKRALMEVERADWLLSHRVIRAPIAGVVTEVVKYTGEKVNADEAVTTILDPVLLIARISFPEQELPRIAPGLRVAVLVDSLGREVEGVVYTVDPVVDAGTRTFFVDCLVENTRGLAPGMFVKVRLPVQSPARRLLIPAGAFIPEEGGGYVYTVSANDRIFRTPVTCEEYGGEELIVLEGLEEGQRVVVDPVMDLLEGMRVAVRESR
jgi:multidrug efflux pump subunit AcrA (membrane-fusion protein)